MLMYEYVGVRRDLTYEYERLDGLVKHSSEAGSDFTSSFTLLGRKLSKISRNVSVR